MNYNLFNVKETDFALLAYKMLKECNNGIVEINSTVRLEGVTDILAHDKKIILKGKEQDAIINLEKKEEAEICAYIENKVVNIELDWGSHLGV